MIRCSNCGRFVSYDDLDSGAAQVEFTPDTYFTVEEIEFFCRKCVAQTEMDLQPQPSTQSFQPT